MKAIVYTRYGPPDVLQLREMKKPVPKDNEVLIRIHATTVTKFDCWMRSFTVPTRLFALLFGMNFGLRTPKKQILGTECAGVIEAVGSAVTAFKPGNPVCAYLGMNMGAYAEYLCVPENGVLVSKPDSMTFEEAAAIQQGALTALFFLKKAHIAGGQKILVYGASGGVGLSAVQLAKYYGADVTGVCSTSKLELVKSVGADKVIDYTKEDFTTRGDTYDIIFDTIGKSPFSGSVRSLTKEGVYLLATYRLPKLFRIIWHKLTSRKTFLSPLLEEKTEDMLFLCKLVEAGKLKSVIDRSYPLEQAVEAHRYVDSGQKKGLVVLTVAHTDSA